MPPAPSPEEELPPVALEVACQSSTSEWQLHLEQLFNNARDRFPDVVWELQNESEALPSEEVWGHKAMVYARAPPTFQARYFSFRPPPIASPSPYAASPMPAQSAVSLGALSLSIGADAPSPARSPSPSSGALRAFSPAPSTTPGQLMRLTTTIASALFSQELEYLYTGKSFGDAFEFLFDSPEKREEGDGEKNRLEKLRKDLVFMWRSRLYSDVRIQLAGFSTSSSASPGDPTATAVFSSHRFILVSRSPYFRTQLLGSFALPTPSPGQPLTLTLPSPPFTPASLHFTLGFIYTGTLTFSHRTYDLETAFHIMRAATYLSMISLYTEIEARIIEEMTHGLFHAYTPFDEYEKLTACKWGVSGCKCRQCARRAPRVLEFAVLEDVKNERLANGARRALVGLFGDGWCTPEFAALPQKTRESLLRGVHKRTVPFNVFPLLYAAQRAMARLNSVMDPWAHTVREMVIAARKGMDDLMCEKAEACFEQPEWLSVMDADGGRFEDGEKVEWVMDCLRRGLNEKNAGLVYQTVVSSILLRPHPEDPNATVLSNTSGIRQQVEMTRMDVIKWMRKRWFSVQQEGGFDSLEGWALKELSHELEVPVEDLMRPPPTSPTKGTPTRTGLRPITGKPEGDGDTASMTSLRASVLNRNMAKTTTSTSASSVRSVARSVASTSSRASGAGVTPRARPPAASLSASTSSLRPPSQTSVASSVVSSVRTPSVASSVRAPSVASSVRAPSQASSRAPSQASARTTSQVSVRSPSQAARASRPTLSTVSSRKSVASSVTHSERPKSVAASVDSVRSHASTIRKTSAPTAAGPSTLRPRPGSNLSTRSDASTAFKTARSEVNTGAPTTRRGSVASTASNVTAGRQATAGSSKKPRSRRGSTASTASAASSVASTAPRMKKAGTAKTPPVPKRPTSTASVRSNVSAVSMTNRAAAGKAAAAKAVEKRESIGKPPVPTLPRKNGTTPKSASAPLSAAAKGKGRANGSNIDSGSEALSTPTSSTASEASTVKAQSVKSVLRKESADTITDSTTTTTPGTPRPPKPVRPPPKEPGAPSPQPPPPSLGATLNVGIPCIISSKRSRFRAFARYIGELEGEPGPWVGVEVPVGEGWGADKLEGRQWNDGTWAGRRYFDIGAGLDWDEGDERRKRRKEGSGGVSRHQTLKREGEQLGTDRSKRLRSVSPAVSDVSTTESRGLFVRPQEVIYVVDAEPDF